MQFNLNEMQTMIQDGARRLLAESLDSEQKQAAEHSGDGFPTEVWEQLCELGWTGAALPEDSGGGGLGMLDLSILAEEIGRAGASLPLVTSSGLCATILQNVEQTSFVKGLLGELATEAVFLAPALIDEGARDERSEPRAKIETGEKGAVISGSKVMVPFASASQCLLVTALNGEGDLVLVAVDMDANGISLSRHQTTGAHPLFHIDLDGVAVADERIIATGPSAQLALNKALDVATILATAEAVGNCEGMLGLGAEYASVREQFGSKIGSFQAVSHPLADMRIQSDALRLLVYETCWMLDQGKDVTLEVSETKVTANEAIVKMVHAAHAMHGAIGYTMEYDLQLYTRRARAFCMTYGDTYSQTERAAIALGL